MKITNHMNTKIFTWKPSDWEENHGSLYYLQISFARIKNWMGQSTPYNLLMENKDSFSYSLTFQHQPRGAPTP